jgi:hypothetical protein
MITYHVRYTLESETQPAKSVTDSIDSSHALTPKELSDKISVQWAWVRGETNEVTEFTVLHTRGE